MFYLPSTGSTKVISHLWDSGVALGVQTRRDLFRTLIGQKKKTRYSHDFMTTFHDWELLAYQFMTAYS